MNPGVKLLVSKVISKSKCLYGLKVVLSLVIVASLLTLLMLGNVEVSAESCDQDCRDECHDDCSSACDCVNCPPSLVFIHHTYWTHTDLRAVLPTLVQDNSMKMEQKWFTSIDHPPQNSL